MARISLGDGGRAVAPPVATDNRGIARAAFATPIAEVGDAVLATSTRLLRQERADQAVKDREAEQQHRQAFMEAERKRVQDEDQARRNKAAASWAEYQVDSSALVADLGTRLTEGQITREQAQKELEDGSARIRKARVDSLDPASQDLLRDNLILHDGRTRQQFQGVLQKHARDERAATYNQTREALQRLALTDSGTAIRQMEALASTEGAALFGADRAGKDLQQFREGVTFTEIDRRISANQKNGKGLAALAADLAGDKYADLAPERRNFLEGKIQRNQQHLANLAEQAERRRLHALDMQFKRLTWYVENGRDIPTPEFDSFTKAAKGTPLADVANTLLAEQKAVSELSSLTPDRMVARVKEIETNYGPTPSREQIVHVEKLKRYVDRSVKQLRESPLEFSAQRDGSIVEPLDFTRPDSWAANLQSRAAILGELSQRTGAAPKGLLKQEVEMFRQVLTSAPTDQKRALLMQLRQGFGSDKVFRATMGQISPDDPVTAAAGVLASKGQESSKAWDVSGRLLRGQELLRPDTRTDGKPVQGRGGKALAMPKDDEMRLAWADYARNTFADQAEIGDRYFQAARALYAQATDAEGDLSGTLVSRRWKKAMEEATGGLSSRNGRSVVLPYGMPEAEFRDGLKARAQALGASGRLPEGMNPSRLLSLPMQNVGDGKYILRAGDGVLVDKAGKRIVFDFDEPVATAEPSTPRRRTAGMAENAGGAATGMVLQ